MVIAARDCIVRWCFFLSYINFFVDLRDHMHSQADAHL